MKLTSCRVTDYRSITDSGWVDVDDIAVIVGKNESGKTSFLKALWRLNPFSKEGYKIDREWPSGRRKEKSPDKVVARGKFSFEPDEIAAIEATHESAKGITGVEVSRTYAGTYKHTFTPTEPASEHNVDWVVDLVRSNLSTPPEDVSEGFKDKYGTAFEQMASDIEKSGGSRRALKLLPTFKTQILEFRNPHHSPDNAAAARTGNTIDRLLREIQATPLLRVVDLVHQYLPTFIYMDDHRIFAGSAQLDDVLKHRDAKKLSAEEETIIVIMEMAGLDLAEEVKKGAADDREQRMLDMNDASHTLTDLIAERWSQRKYQIMFQADGQHFMTFVRDEKDKALIPLEERSKGFQWFFSFDMRFMYETDGQFKNAIILLDEPGLHLHAAAQKDLLERMKAYAKGNKLVYSTHLPFMIDFKRLDNIYVAEEISGEGTKVHKNWATADKDARFTLQAALGLSWSQSLFVGQFNLVVEGVDDFWFLTVFSTMFEEADQPGLDSRLVVMPAGGASKVAYVGTILKGQDLNVAVLLDSDAAGKQAFEQLVHQWILQDKLVVMVGDAIGTTPCAIEDLFGEAYYLSKVNEAYAKELSSKPLSLDPNTKGKVTLVDRVTQAFEKRGLGDYNKGRVAKRIMSELAGRKLSEIDKETVEGFRKLIDAINAVAATWT